MRLVASHRDGSPHLLRHHESVPNVGQDLPDYARLVLMRLRMRGLVALGGGLRARLFAHRIVRSGAPALALLAPNHSRWPRRSHPRISPLTRVRHNHCRRRDRPRSDAVRLRAWRGECNGVDRMNLEWKIRWAVRGGPRRNCRFRCSASSRRRIDPPRAVPEPARRDGSAGLDRASNGALLSALCPRAPLPWPESGCSMTLRDHEVKDGPALLGRGRRESRFRPARARRCSSWAPPPALWEHLSGPVLTQPTICSPQKASKAEKRGAQAVAALVKACATHRRSAPAPRDLSSRKPHYITTLARPGPEWRTAAQGFGCRGESRKNGSFSWLPLCNYSRIPNPQAPCRR